MTFKCVLAFKNSWSGWRVSSNVFSPLSFYFFFFFLLLLYGNVLHKPLAPSRDIEHQTELAEEEKNFCRLCLDHDTDFPLSRTSGKKKYICIFVCVWLIKSNSHYLYGTLICRKKIGLHINIFQINICLFIFVTFILYFVVGLFRLLFSLFCFYWHSTICMWVVKFFQLM